MFKYIFFSGPDIQNGKVRSPHSPIIKKDWVFITVGDTIYEQRISNYFLRLGPDPFTLQSVVFRCTWFKSACIIFNCFPSFYILIVIQYVITNQCFPFCRQVFINLNKSFFILFPFVIQLHHSRSSCNVKWNTAFSKSHSIMLKRQLGNTSFFVLSFHFFNSEKLDYADFQTIIPNN